VHSLQILQAKLHCLQVSVHTLQVNLHVIHIFFFPLLTIIHLVKLAFQASYIVWHFALNDVLDPLVFYNAIFGELNWLIDSCG
jgi:hypothetical protein